MRKNEVENLYIHLHNKKDGLVQYNRNNGIISLHRIFCNLNSNNTLEVAP